MNTPVLQVKGLTKIFKAKKGFFFSKNPELSYTAVENVSFQLNKGEILGILGPNGAGKTTTIQMLLGTLTPTYGTIHYFDMDFEKHRNEILQNVSHASAYNKLPGFLTVAESLEIFGRIYGLSSKQRTKRIYELLDFFGIVHLAKKKCQTLSAGQMTRLMLVKAFLSHPKIVLLDEPTASLDPDIAYETRQFILEQRRQFDVSIILTSHNMQEVSEICSRVLVLKDGKIIEEDTPKKLAKSVALTKIRLLLDQTYPDIMSLFDHLPLEIERSDKELSIEVDEHAVAQVLMILARHQINYSHIEIIKPSLEDYFLHISRKK